MLLGDIVPDAVYVGSNLIFPVAGGGGTWGAATGGIETDDGDYRIHTFTADDDFIVTGTIPACEVLLVAGGGAGGSFRGGGGGGGGVIHTYLSDDVVPGVYPIVVGGGGVAPDSYGQGTNGEDSTAFGLTAVGGGAGGVYSYAPNGLAGGSGGGAGPGGSAGAGTAGQGYSGSEDTNASTVGGGGGGALSEQLAAEKWHGWHGRSSAISGAHTIYGGGGGGCNSGAVTRGGAGGGGAGDPNVGGDGTDGLGGGGGSSYNSGAGKHGGAGGSGVVIIRYPIAGPPDPPVLEVVASFDFYAATGATHTSGALALLEGDVILVIASTATTSAYSKPYSSGGEFFTPIVANVSNPSSVIHYARVTVDGAQTVTQQTPGAGGGSVFVLRGVDLRIPPTAGVETFTASTTPTFSGADVLTAGSLVIVQCGSIDDNTLSVTTGGWTQHSTQNIGGIGAYCLAYQSFDVSGATGSVAFSQATNGPDAGKFSWIVLHAHSAGSLAAAALPMLPTESTLNATYGDHFTGPALNTSKWTRYNISSGAETSYPDATVLEVALADTTAARQYHQPAPSGDFSVVLRQSLNGGGSMIGPMIIDSSGNGIAASQYGDGAGYMWYVNAYGYGGTGALLATTVAVYNGQWNWVEINKSGTDYKWRISGNGFTWSPWSTTYSWAGTVDRVGFGRIYGTSAETWRVDSFNIIV